MARKRSRETPSGMTVRPPLAVAAALGDYKSTEFTLALRLAAEALGQAATETSALFSPAEWSALAVALADRVVEPEVSEPGALLAEAVEKASTRYGATASAAGHQGGTPEANAKGHNKGAAAAAAAPSVADRLRALSYWQAWAVLIAVRFRLAHSAKLGESAHWWELPVRWKVLCAENDWA